MLISSFYKDKVVLITGSSRGIGKELARQVLLNNGKVVITARDSNRLKLAEEEFAPYKSSMLILPSDVTNYESNEILIQKTIERFGKLDVMITNAALSNYGEVEIIKPGVSRHIIDTNIYGSMFPIMVAIPELKKTQGSILLVSSVAGLYGIPKYSAYSLSKMALKGLAQSLRIELHSYKIFVGIAYPGFTENESMKTTLNPYGQLEPVGFRPKKIIATRQETALKLLGQIMKRKNSSTYSILGNITDFLSRYMPFALRFILQREYLKQ